MLLKNKNTMKTMADVDNYLQMQEREIFLDVLSPQIANSINRLIRYWNIEDENNVVLESRRKPIKIYINSLGGSLDAALTICESIKLSKAPVYTYNIGHADLESLLVFMAGYKRYGYLNSVYTFSDTILPASEDPKDNSALFIRHYVENLFFERTIMKENQFDKYMTSGRYVLTSEDAFKLRMVNQIVRK